MINSFREKYSYPAYSVSKINNIRFYSITENLNVPSVTSILRLTNTTQQIDFTSNQITDSMEIGNYMHKYLEHYVSKKEEFRSDSKNYEIAKIHGFKHLGHEYDREGAVENYDQVDSLIYLLNPFLKYPKYGHSITTDIVSRWIRYGLKTREEMIPFVEKHDGQLDQGVVEKFCEFTKMSTSDFYNVLDKWYNPNLFEKDSFGIWKKKFKVGQ